MATAHPFWDKLAQNYPSYDNPQMGRDVRIMIDAATDFGVDFNNAKVLDIGCGTGTVAIPLAAMGANVDAMDISPEMLKRLEEDAARAGVGHAVTTCLSDWDGFDLAGSYDVVIASMTPAVMTDAHYEKYIKAAGRWGIFVGWGDFKRNPFLEALVTAHGAVTAAPRNNAAAFHSRITAQGKKVALTWFETAWEERYSMEEAREYAVSHLERDGIAPDLEIIETTLALWLLDGTVTVTTHAQKGAVVWEA